MTLRSSSERTIQTVSYEVCGLLIVIPYYSMLFGTTSGHSFLLLASVSGVVLIWAPLHNTLFDILDLHAFGRLASNRPHKWRIVHATSLELSSIVLTMPVIMAIAGHGIWQALAVNVSLTLFYTFYGYFFHFVYDHLRPVRSNGSGGNRIRKEFQ